MLHDTVYQSDQVYRRKRGDEEISREIFNKMVLGLLEKNPRGDEEPPIASAIHCCDFHTTIVEVFTRYDRISALNRGAKSVVKADKAATAAAAKDMELDTPVDESVASLVEASVSPIAISGDKYILSRRKLCP